MTALNVQPPGRFTLDACSVLAAACTLAYQHQQDAAALQLDKLDHEQLVRALVAADAVRARLVELVGPPPIPDGVAGFAIRGPHTDRIRGMTP